MRRCTQSSEVSSGRRMTCHIRLKRDLFKHSKQVGARRIPLLRQMNQGPVISEDV